jgi:hypothetical protein
MAASTSMSRCLRRQRRRPDDKIGLSDQRSWSASLRPRRGKRSERHHLPDLCRVRIASALVFDRRAGARGVTAATLAGLLRNCKLLLLTRKQNRRIALGLSIEETR